MWSNSFCGWLQDMPQMTKFWLRGTVCIRLSLPAKKFAMWGMQRLH